MGLDPCRLAMHCSIVTLALAACDTTAPVGEGPGGRVAVRIAPLALTGVGNASWRLTVANAVGDTVWTRDIDADDYGDGAGSVSYVGTCDAGGDPADNTVTVELLALFDIGGTPVPASTYVRPPPATRTVRCVGDADVAVDFDITVARAAQQGFFDFAISFSDVFCSAKLDCRAAFLHQPSGGRGPTAILGLACTSSTQADDTVLYLDPLQVACADRSATVDPSAGPGNLADGAGITQNAGTPVLYGAQVNRGTEQLNAGKVYWNVLLGLETAPSCTLTTAATAHTGAFADGVHTPAGATWPYIAWNVPLTDGSGAMTCSNQALGAAGSDVTIAYAPDDTPKAFGFTYDGDLASATTLPPPTTTVYEAATLGDDFGFDYGFSPSGWFDESPPRIPFHVQNYSASNSARAGMLTLDDATKQATVTWVSGDYGNANNFTAAQLDGRNLLRGRRVSGQWDCFVAGFEWGNSGLTSSTSDLNQGNQRYLGTYRLNDTRGFAWSASNYQSLRMFDYTGGGSITASAVADFGQSYAGASFAEWDGDLVVHTKLPGPTFYTNPKGSLLLFKWNGGSGSTLTQVSFHDIIPSGMSTNSIHGQLVRTSYGAILLDRDTRNTWRIGRTGDTLTVDATGGWTSPAVPLQEIYWTGIDGSTGKYTRREVATDVFETLRFYTDGGTGHLDSVSVDLRDFANPTVTVLRADLYTWDTAQWTVSNRGAFYRPGTDDVIFGLHGDPISLRQAKLVYVENAF